MLFSAESIDGLLHQLGGLRFRAECNLVPSHLWAHAYLNQQQPKSAANIDQETNDTIEVSNIVNSPNPKTKCPVGTAVSTPAVGGEIPSHYDRIIHTVPPFYNYPPSMTDELKRLLGIEIMGENENDLHQFSKELLRSCYRQSLKVAFESSNDKDLSYSLRKNPIASMLGLGKCSHNQQSIRKRVAVPLLGAGCRDFPKDVALEVAAMESASWLLLESKKEHHTTDSSPEEELVVAFGLLENVDAEALAYSIEETIQSRAAVTTDKDLNR